MTFWDVATTYSDIVAIKQKSEVPDVFMNTMKHWKQETGFKVKDVQSDGGGGEYMKSTFIVWLKLHSITHEHSSPYEPEQNRVAEREMYGALLTCLAR